ncbi:MAG: pilus assembly protein PilP, partial [Colwellia sp.]
MRILVLIALIMLTGCYNDTTELRTYMEQVKATTTSKVDPMPEVPPYNHYDYSAFDLRSPFSLP